jgi:rhamnogalacturonan endolyase
MLSIPLLVLLLTATSASAADVKITFNGKPAVEGDYKPADVTELVLSNGLLSITFGPDGSATSLVKNGQELAHNLNGLSGRDPHRQRTWYVDYDAGRSRLVAENIRIVKVTPEMAHIAMIDNGTTSKFYLEHHIVMMKGESGLYGYVICRNLKGVELGGEMRSMYRLDRDIFDWAYVSERTGQQPRYGELEPLPKVQDETWKMPDGTIYQKYDYSGYIAENPMWGHYGHGFGVWFMPVSTEYYAGGPLRQDLLVHQDALILNYFQGAHYGGGGPGNFRNHEKLFGPWFVYVNTGDSKTVIADAKAKAQAEQAKWPYRWVTQESESVLYPLERTKVTGQLQSMGKAMVVLGQPRIEIYKQAGDFIFYAPTDANGKFTIPNARPGTYSLYAYAVEGSNTAQLERTDIEISGAEKNLGSIPWPTPRYTFLWQIGKADRMAGEFKYGNELRNIKWIGMVPADLTYTIGRSKDREDWYFAQGKVGNWDVHFDLPRLINGTARLTIAIAGVSGNPKLKVLVNEHEVKTLAYQNDAATYRAALRSARYRVEDISFPASILEAGTNTVRFAMTGVSSNGGIMYDTIKLELDEDRAAANTTGWSGQNAAAYLDERSAWWSTWPSAQRDHGTFCISCHTALPYALGRPALRAALHESAPSEPEQKLLDNIAKRVQMWKEIESVYSDEKQGIPKTAEAYGTESILNALILANYDARSGSTQLSSMTQEALRIMWGLQRDSGAWWWLDFHNEPWEAPSSEYYGAALAAVAVGTTPASYRESPEIQAKTARLKTYLVDHRAQTTPVNRALLLWASGKWPGLLKPSEQAAIVSEMLAKQQEDGGWTMSSLINDWQRRDKTPFETKSDGYATGLVALALQQSGTSRDHAGLKRGLAWLEHNQEALGRWPAESLNKKRDPASAAWRFMSDAATAYAVLALTQ